jgi:hypothetical protein
MRTAGFVTAAIFLQRREYDGSIFWLTAVVLTLEGKCLRRRAKPAHLEGHLPHTSSGYFPCQLASSLATLKPSYKRESVLFWREEPVQQSFVSSREQERQQKGLSGKVCRIPPPDEPYKNRQSV